MFKKFKDKLAEEMKQSPARLQASVQQLAQAVVSPALSNSSIQEVSASNDNFSLTEDGDETPKNTPAKHSFQNVDLMSPSPNRVEISRRSSVSSVTSDASSLFPMYESPPMYHLQSDMDQSASEVDDNISPHLDRVTKDQLYSAYRKVQAKYHKYRGRYTDLAAHYRELDRVKTKLESVLVETQDKVLRRIADLKEQCQLEQQAKAHLEEALRNDIEEKDHIIDTLNTKVKLLQQVGESTLENSVPENADHKQSSKANLIDLANESSSNDEALSAENAQLRDKLKKLEGLVLKYKESLKRNKEKFTEMMKDKNNLESDCEALKSSTAAMEGELSVARAEIEKLADQVETLHKHEEESAISLAENKLSVHRELEEKEEQIKQLQRDLKHAVDDRENLNEIVAKYKAESSKSKLPHVDSSLATEKTTILHNASKEKIEMTRSASQTMKHHEEIDRGKEIANSEENKNVLEVVMHRLKEREAEFQEVRQKLDELEKHSTEYKHEREALQVELTNYKIRYMELKSEHDAQKIIAEEKRKNADATIEKLQAIVQSVDKELENMRSALVDRDQVCENYNKKVQQYATMLEKTKCKIIEQETEIKSVTENAMEDKLQLSKTREELENKQTELNTAHGELEFCKSTIDDLTNKVQADGSAISLLKKERSDLINRLVYYKDCMQRLRQDCATIKEEFSNRKIEMSDLSTTLVASLARLEVENMTLNSRMDELRLKVTDSEQFMCKEAELQSELDKTRNLKSTLEEELKESNERLIQLTLKSERYDELDVTNNKLIAEIDNLHFKIHDLEKASRELTDSRREVELLQERLVTLEKLELENYALNSKVDNLTKDLARIGHMSEKVNELNAKLHEANNVVDALRSSSSERDAFEEESRTLRSEVVYLRDDIAIGERKLKIRDEKIAQQEQHIAHLISTCDSHIQTIEEHVQKYLNLEEEYQTTRENHVKQIAELMENNKVLQETINVKLVQLKKMKIIKDRQSKTIEEMNIELNKLKIKHAELSSMLEAAEKQIESLKLESSQLATISLENKDLKDKHNNLLSHNRKLCENEEALKQKIANYEKDIEELRQNVESYKSQVDNRDEKIERLSIELTIINDKLVTNEKDLQETKERLNEYCVELQTKISELNIVTTNGNVVREENEQFLVETKLLRDEVERLKDVEDKSARLKSQLDDLTQKCANVDMIRSTNNELLAERIALQNRIIEMERVNSSCNAELQAQVNSLQCKITDSEALRRENDRLRSEIDALRSATDSSTELDTLRNLLTEKDAQNSLLEDKNSNMLQEITNLKHSLLEADKKIDDLRISIDLEQKKIANLQSELDSLVCTNDALREELASARRSDGKAESQLDDDKLREEKKRLEAQLDEALITFQAKETQMQVTNNELKTQTDQLRQQLRTSEEEQGMRLKQLVKEFQAQLHDKEEELQAALEKRFDRQHNYESDLVQQYKEQLKDFQVELTEKSEQIESLVLEKKDVVTEKGKDIDRLVQTIAQIKREHANEIKEMEKKWKAIMQQRIDNLQAKHEEELNELTKEWQNERKPDVQTDAASEELENTSRVAMAAIQTNTGSIHTMQQTLTSQRREIAELRKLVKLRHDTLEDSTEIEYLRNILFEYMMGRETMVLARVIAAVVKFDQEQTAKILKKEEDKLTLFGSLGLT